MTALTELKKSLLRRNNKDLTSLSQLQELTIKEAEDYICLVICVGENFTDQLSDIAPADSLAYCLDSNWPKDLVRKGDKYIAALVDLEKYRFVIGGLEPSEAKMFLEDGNRVEAGLVVSKKAQEELGIKIDESGAICG